MVRETRYLWVGNIPGQVTEEKITEQFQRHGRIQNVKIHPRTEGDAHISATVAFTDIKSAAKAHNTDNKLEGNALLTEYSESLTVVSPALLASTSKRVADAAAAAAAAVAAKNKQSETNSTGPSTTSRHKHIDRLSNSSQASPCPSAGSGSKHGSGRGRRSRSRSLSSHGSSRSSKSKSRSNSGERSGSKSSRIKSRLASSVSIQGDKNDSLKAGEQNGERPMLGICIKHLPLRSSDTSLRDGLYHEYKKVGKVTIVHIVGQNEDRYAIVSFRKNEDAIKALEASQEKYFFGNRIKAVLHEGIANKWKCRRKKVSGHKKWKYIEWKCLQSFQVDETELRAMENDLDEFNAKATRTLFVGNLDKDISAQELKDYFKGFGEIIDIDVKRQGTISAYAFIQFSDITSVVDALRRLDGESIGGNKVKLGFGKSMPTNCIWLDNLAEAVTDRFLVRQFSRFGAVSHSVLDKINCRALVYCDSGETAQFAVAEMRARLFYSKKIMIDFASRDCQTAFFEKMVTTGQLHPGERPDERQGRAYRPPGVLPPFDGPVRPPPFFDGRGSRYPGGRPINGGGIHYDRIRDGFYENESDEFRDRFFDNDDAYSQELREVRFSQIERRNHTSRSPSPIDSHRRIYDDRRPYNDRLIRYPDDKIHSSLEDLRHDKTSRETSPFLRESSKLRTPPSDKDYDSSRSKVDKYDDKPRKNSIDGRLKESRYLDNNRNSVNSSKIRRLDEISTSSEGKKDFSEDQLEKEKRLLLEELKQLDSSDTDGDESRLKKPRLSESLDKQSIVTPGKVTSNKNIVKKENEKIPIDASRSCRKQMEARRVMDQQQSQSATNIRRLSAAGLSDNDDDFIVSPKEIPTDFFSSKRRKIGDNNDASTKNRVYRTKLSDDNLTSSGDEKDLTRIKERLRDLAPPMIKIPDNTIILRSQHTSPMSADLHNKHIKEPDLKSPSIAQEPTVIPFEIDLNSSNPPHDPRDPDKKTDETVSFPLPRFAKNVPSSHIRTIPLTAVHTPPTTSSASFTTCTSTSVTTSTTTTTSTSTMSHNSILSTSVSETKTTDVKSIDSKLDSSFESTCSDVSPEKSVTTDEVLTVEERIRRIDETLNRCSSKYKIKKRADAAAAAAAAVTTNFCLTTQDKQTRTPSNNMKWLLGRTSVFDHDSKRLESNKEKYDTDTTTETPGGLTRQKSINKEYARFQSGPYMGQKNYPHVAGEGNVLDGPFLPDGTRNYASVQSVQSSLARRIIETNKPPETITKRSESCSSIGSIGSVSPLTPITPGMQLAPIIVLPMDTLNTSIPITPLTPITPNTPVATPLIAGQPTILTLPAMKKELTDTSPVKCDNNSTNCEKNLNDNANLPTVIKKESPMSLLIPSKRKSSDGSEHKPKLKDISKICMNITDGLFEPEDTVTKCEPDTKNKFESSHRKEEQRDSNVEGLNSTSFTEDKCELETVDILDKIVHNETDDFLAETIVNSPDNSDMKSSSGKDTTIEESVSISNLQNSQCSQNCESGDHSETPDEKSTSEIKVEDGLSQCGSSGCVKVECDIKLEETDYKTGDDGCESVISTCKGGHCGSEAGCSDDEMICEESKNDVLSVVKSLEIAVSNKVNCDEIEKCSDSKDTGVNNSSNIVAHSDIIVKIEAEIHAESPISIKTDESVLTPKDKQPSISTSPIKSCELNSKPVIAEKSTKTVDVLSKNPTNDVKKLETTDIKSSASNSLNENIKITTEIKGILKKQSKDEISTKSEQSTKETSDRKGILKQQSRDEKSTDSKDAKKEAKNYKQDTKDCRQETKDTKQGTKDHKQETKDSKQGTKDHKQETKDTKQGTKDHKQETKDTKQGTKNLKQEIKDKKQDGKDNKQEIKDKKQDVKDDKQETKDKKQEMKEHKQDIKDKKPDMKDHKQETKDKKHDTKDHKQDTKDKKQDTKDQKRDTKDNKQEAKDHKQEVKDKKQDMKDQKQDTPQKDQKISSEKNDKSEPKRSIFSKTITDRKDNIFQSFSRTESFTSNKSEQKTSSERKDNTHHSSTKPDTPVKNDSRNNSDKKDTSNAASVKMESKSDYKADKKENILHSSKIKTEIKSKDFTLHSKSETPSKNKDSSNSSHKSRSDKKEGVDQKSSGDKSSKDRTEQRNSVDRKESTSNSKKVEHKNGIDTKNSSIPSSNNKKDKDDKGYKERSNFKSKILDITTESKPKLNEKKDKYKEHKNSDDQKEKSEKEHKSKIDHKVKSEHKSDGNTSKEHKSDGNTSKEPKSDGNASKEHKSDGNTSKEHKSDGNTSKEHKSDGNTSKEHKSDGNTSKEHKSDGNTNKEHKSDGNTSKEHKSDGNTSKEHKSDGNTSKEHKSDGNTSKEHKSDGNTSKEHKSDGNTSKEHKSDGNTSKEHKSDGNTSKEHKSDGNTIKEHKSDKVKSENIFKESKDIKDITSTNKFEYKDHSDKGKSESKDKKGDSSEHKRDKSKDYHSEKEKSKNDLWKDIKKESKDRNEHRESKERTDSKNEKKSDSKEIEYSKTSSNKHKSSDAKKSKSSDSLVSGSKHKSDHSKSEKKREKSSSNPGRESNDDRHSEKSKTNVHKSKSSKDDDDDSDSDDEMDNLTELERRAEQEKRDHETALALARQFDAESMYDKVKRRSNKEIKEREMDMIRSKMRFLKGSRKKKPKHDTDDSSGDESEGTESTTSSKKGVHARRKRFCFDTSSDDENYSGSRKKEKHKPPKKPSTPTVKKQSRKPSKPSHSSSSSSEWDPHEDSKIVAKMQKSHKKKVKKKVYTSDSDISDDDKKSPSKWESSSSAKKGKSDDYGEKSKKRNISGSSSKSKFKSSSSHSIDTDTGSKSPMKSPDRPFKFLQSQSDSESDMDSFSYKSKESSSKKDSSKEWKSAKSKSMDGKKVRTESGDHSKKRNYSTSAVKSAKKSEHDRKDSSKKDKKHDSSKKHDSKSSLKSPHSTHNKADYQKDSTDHVEPPVLTSEWPYTSIGSPPPSKKMKPTKAALKEMDDSFKDTHMNPAYMLHKDRYNLAAAFKEEPKFGGFSDLSFDSTHTMFGVANFGQESSPEKKDKKLTDIKTVDDDEDRKHKIPKKKDKHRSDSTSQDRKMKDKHKTDDSSKEADKSKSEVSNLSCWYDIIKDLPTKTEPSIDEVKLHKKSKKVKDAKVKKSESDISSENVLKTKSDDVESTDMPQLFKENSPLDGNKPDLNIESETGIDVAEVSVTTEFDDSAKKNKVRKTHKKGGKDVTIPVKGDSLCVDRSDIHTNIQVNETTILCTPSSKTDFGKKKSKTLNDASTTRHWLSSLQSPENSDEDRNSIDKSFSSLMKTQKLASPLLQSPTKVISETPAKVDGEKSTKKKRHRSGKKESHLLHPNKSDLHTPDSVTSFGKDMTSPPPSKINVNSLFSDTEEPFEPLDPEMFSLSIASPFAATEKDGESGKSTIFNARGKTKAKTSPKKAKSDAKKNSGQDSSVYDFTEDDDNHGLPDKLKHKTTKDSLHPQNDNTKDDPKDANNTEDVPKVVPETVSTDVPIQEATDIIESEVPDVVTEEVVAGPSAAEVELESAVASILGDDMCSVADDKVWKPDNQAPTFDPTKSPCFTMNDSLDAVGSEYIVESTPLVEESSDKPADKLVEEPTKKEKRARKHKSSRSESSDNDKTLDKTLDTSTELMSPAAKRGKLDDSLAVIKIDDKIQSVESNKSEQDEFSCELKIDEDAVQHDDVTPRKHRKRKSSEHSTTNELCTVPEAVTLDSLSQQTNYITPMSGIESKISMSESLVGLPMDTFDQNTTVMTNEAMTNIEKVIHDVSIGLFEDCSHMTTPNKRRASRSRSKSDENRGMLGMLEIDTQKANQDMSLSMANSAIQKQLQSLSQIPNQPLMAPTSIPGLLSPGLVAPGLQTVSSKGFPAQANIKQPGQPPFYNSPDFMQPDAQVTQQRHHVFEQPDYNHLQLDIPSSEADKLNHPYMPNLSVHGVPVPQRSPRFDNVNAGQQQQQQPIWGRHNMPVNVASLTNSKSGIAQPAHSMPMQFSPMNPMLASPRQALQHPFHQPPHITSTGTHTTFSPSYPEHLDNKQQKHANNLARRQSQDLPHNQPSEYDVMKAQDMYLQSHGGVGIPKLHHSPHPKPTPNGPSSGPSGPLFVGLPPSQRPSSVPNDSSSPMVSPNLRSPSVHGKQPGLPYDSSKDLHRARDMLVSGGGTFIAPHVLPHGMHSEELMQPMPPPALSKHGLPQGYREDQSIHVGVVHPQPQTLNSVDSCLTGQPIERVPNPGMKTSHMTTDLRGVPNHIPTSSDFRHMDLSKSAKDNMDKMQTMIQQIDANRASHKSKPQSHSPAKMTTPPLNDVRSTHAQITGMMQQAMPPSNMVNQSPYRRINEQIHACIEKAPPAAHQHKHADKLERLGLPENHRMSPLTERGYHDLLPQQDLLQKHMYRGELHVGHPSMAFPPHAAAPMGLHPQVLYRGALPQQHQTYLASPAPDAQLMQALHPLHFQQLLPQHAAALHMEQQRRALDSHPSPHITATLASPHLNPTPHLAASPHLTASQPIPSPTLLPHQGPDVIQALSHFTPPGFAQITRQQKPDSDPTPEGPHAFLQRYPVLWQGLLALKAEDCVVQMHFVAGTRALVKVSMPAATIDGGAQPLRIAQRMRLDQTQLEGVAKRMQFDQDFCMLLALPCGRDRMDVAEQTNKLSHGFIKYLQQKQAAGIVNIAGPGCDQTSYVVHIFPPCSFSNTMLSKLSFDLFKRIDRLEHMVIIITTV